MVGLRKVFSPNRKAKQHLLGQSDQPTTIPSSPPLMEPDDDDGSKDRTTNNNVQNHCKKHRNNSSRGLNLGKNLLLEIGLILTFAIVFRRLWILHGITLVFLSRMFKVIFAWIGLCTDTGVFQEMWAVSMSIVKQHTDFLEKLVEGDSFRLFVAGSYIQNMNSWGIDVQLAILREQMKQINKLQTSEMKEVIERGQEMQQQANKGNADQPIAIQYGADDAP